MIGFKILIFLFSILLVFVANCLSDNDREEMKGFIYMGYYSVGITFLAFFF